MYRLRIAIALWLLLILPLRAQRKPDDDLVRIVATVTDGRGRYVSDFKAEDFTVREDDRVQTVLELTQTRNLSASVGILLDTSGSMQRKMARATNAIEDFVSRLDKNDDIFLITFSDTPTVLSDFTEGRPEFISKLRRVRAAGESAMYDALDEGFRQLNRGDRDREVLLLVTDGADSASVLSYDRILRKIRETPDVLIYALGIPAGFGDGFQANFAPQIVIQQPGIPTIPIPLPGGRTTPVPVPGNPPGLPPPPSAQPDSGETVNMTVLDSLASASGGAAWRAEDPQRRVGEPIDRILSRISAEMRGQYVVGFRPSRARNDGQWHDLEIQGSDIEFRVRHRPEYFEPRK